MRTNGFALFRGDRAPSLAQAAVRQVERYCVELVVSTPDGKFEGLDDAARLSGRREVALAYSLERRSRRMRRGKMRGNGGGDDHGDDGAGFSLIHGYASEARRPGDGLLPEGEYSILGRGTAGIYAGRDPLGTRGLWAVLRGRSAGSFASDHRLLPGDATLLPPGTVYQDHQTRRTDKNGRKGRLALSFGEAVTALASLLEGSVERRVRGQARVAVSFSGGLDSSLLALLASRHADQVVLCSAFAPGSRDEGQTEKAAALLGLRLETALLDRETLAERSGEAQLPPGDATEMDKALWCIYSTSGELAKKNEARMILLGQLADELFGGYMKYALKAQEEGAEAAEAMMMADVRGCAERGFLRDEAACSATCEVRFPYADERIASFASRLPLDYKIRGGERKAVLRAAALELGLPEELATAPKKAAQFSSGAAKLLNRRRW